MVSSDGPADLRLRVDLAKRNLDLAPGHGFYGSRRRELLNPIVPPICNVDIAAGIYADFRLAEQELSVSRTLGTPFYQEGPIAVDLRMRWSPISAT